jgi:DNA sulfur modification protein DndC
MNFQAPKHIETLVAQGALFVVNHSGGKDSQAMLIALRAMGIPDAQLVIVHAELPEVDWEGIPQHIEANSFGLPIHTCKAVKTFFEMVEHRQAFPSPTLRQCTSDLKRGPIEKLVRQIAGPGSLIVNCMGLRAAESTSRAKATVFKLGRDKLQGNGRTWYEWLPIHGMSTDEVFETIAAAGQEPHWAYKAGMTRLSCCFCVMSSRGDLHTAATLKPELARRYAETERRIGQTMLMPKNGKREWLDEILDIPAAPIVANANEIWQAALAA